MPEAFPVIRTAEPSNQEELVEAVRESCASGTPLYPVGGGTSLRLGTPAQRPGCRLGLERLNRVVDYPARDMTISVEAGIKMAELAAVLARENQWLPIDVAKAAEATLGGVVAVNQSGPHRYGYGTIRDYVIGMSAIDGRGTPFKGGGRVVKNVAGYDFCKLLTGSLGTLGVISQLTLKVRPRPAASAIAACAPADWNHARRLLAALVTTATVPLAVELVVGDAANLPQLVSTNGLAAGRLLVALEGTPDETQWQLARLRAEWRDSGVADADVAEGESAAAWWRCLVEHAAGDDSRLAIKASVTAPVTVDFVERVLACDAAASISAHAGNGIVEARLPSIAAQDAARIVIQKLRPSAVAAGGGLVVTSAPGNADWTRQFVWGPPRAETAVMAAVKRQFDPDHLLNPGRFVFA
jgi:glycolate oxidase FAD binding subunit